MDKILVVEDNPVYLENARRGLAGLDADFLYKSFINMGKIPNVRGVISDIYFPSSAGSKSFAEFTARTLERFYADKSFGSVGVTDLLENSLNLKTYDETKGKMIWPAGYLLAEKMQGRDIPFVFVSSVYKGHGKRRGSGENKSFVACRRFGERLFPEEWEMIECPSTYLERAVISNAIEEEGGVKSAAAWEKAYEIFCSKME